jgi:hypothetical protein
MQDLMDIADTLLEREEKERERRFLRFGYTSYLRLVNNMDELKKQLDLLNRLEHWAQKEANE